MDLRERTIEIAELRDVSLNSSHVFPDFVHCRGELAVTATGDENVRAFACEPLCHRQPDAAIAAGDERDPSFELAHLSAIAASGWRWRSEEHTSELQSHLNLVCRLLLEKKKT